MRQGQTEAQDSTSGQSKDEHKGEQEEAPFPFLIPKFHLKGKRSTHNVRSREGKISSFPTQKLNLTILFIIYLGGASVS